MSMHTSNNNVPGMYPASFWKLVGIEVNQTRKLVVWAYRVGQDPSDSKSNRLHVDTHLPVSLNTCEV